VVHSTTGTNALIEQRGARTGLLTSVGFATSSRCVMSTYDIYDLFLSWPAPLVRAIAV